MITLHYIAMEAKHTHSVHVCFGGVQYIGCSSQRRDCLWYAPRRGKDSYGKLLLSALPVAELRRMGRGLGLADGGRKGKGHLVEKVCTAATKQRLLQTKMQKTEAVEADALSAS